MAEQTLSGLVLDLMNWIEALHEKNLKLQAQIEGLTKELEKSQNSCRESEARLNAYQNCPPPVPVPQIQTQIIDPHHQQAIYHQQFATPQTQYVWATNEVPMQTYYDYGN